VARGKRNRAKKQLAKQREHDRLAEQNAGLMLRARAWLKKATWATLALTVAGLLLKGAGYLTDVYGAKVILVGESKPLPPPSLSPITVSPGSKVITGPLEEHFIIRVLNTGDVDAHDRVLRLDFDPAATAEEFSLSPIGPDENYSVVSSDDRQDAVKLMLPSMFIAPTPDHSVFIARLGTLGARSSRSFEASVRPPAGRTLGYVASVVPESSVSKMLPEYEAYSSKEAAKVGVEKARSEGRKPFIIVLRKPDAGDTDTESYLFGRPDGGDTKVAAPNAGARH
jgi:hypothetical protein